MTPPAFQPGHRVVVLPTNDYDNSGDGVTDPDAEPMAGHYGKVIQVSDLEGKPTPLVVVEIMGKIDGKVSSFIAGNEFTGQPDLVWWFFATELEHID